jgi:8-oxo-dGTP diphosphatase
MAASEMPATTDVLADRADLPRPAVTVDLVLLTLIGGDLRVLLIKRRGWPFADMWAIPGRFVRLDESLEDAARRTLAEQATVRDVYLEQLYTFGEPDRDPRTRVITVVYYALVDAAQITVRPGADGAERRWFSLYDLPPLAFDHATILSYTLQRLQGKLEYTTIGFQLLPLAFTLRELQEVYEAILHRPLEKRNFRKKILATGLLEPTDQTKMEGPHRPARLYRFRPGAAR